jgi:putative transposon-encoded protein
MRVKIRKTDIKLKHNFMNIIARRVTQKVSRT